MTVDDTHLPHAVARLSVLGEMVAAALPEVTCELQVFGSALGEGCGESDSEDTDDAALM